jgi:radical SAM superfamily enzyme YgiQ (UPF0313 family)
MRKKIYLIHPTYRDHRGRLLKGKRLYTISLALPALSSVIPPDWEKQFCFEYFNDIDFDSDASVVGISSMGYEIFRGLEIAAEFKKRGKIVIFGGFQSHLSTAHVAPHCDAIVHGNPGIPDMARILRDAELNSLKPQYHCGIDLNYRLDYTLLDPHKLFFTPVLLSVGCRNACEYCCIGSLYNHQYRLRKLTYVIDELAALHRTTRRIAIVDTNFYNNRGYLIKLCQAMIGHGFRFFWGAQSTIDIGDDIEVLDLLRRAGCRVLFIGMETIDQANLDAVKKNYSADSYQQTIRNIHRAGIKIAAFFMYGLDHDTLQTSSTLSRFIIRNKISLPMLNVLVPLPGTKIYDQLKSQGRLLMSDKHEFLRNNIAYNSSFNLCFYAPKNMTPGEVEDGFIDLLGRLAGWSQVIWRSITRSLSLTAFFLYMNWQFRKEYLELKKRRAQPV